MILYVARKLLEHGRRRPAATRTCGDKWHKGAKTHRLQDFLRDPHFLAAIREHGEPPAEVEAALARPTLQALVLALLAHHDVPLVSLYMGPDPTPLFLLVEGLLEFEQRFVRWRFLHVQLVERIIGPGTGGTGGFWKEPGCIALANNQR
jgi:tryptophan 2,3-dioxygenase